MDDTDLIFEIVKVAVVPLATVLITLIFKVSELQLQKKKIILEKIYDRKYEAYNNLLVKISKYNSDGIITFAELQSEMQSVLLVAPDHIYKQLLPLICSAEEHRVEAVAYSGDNPEQTKRLGVAMRQYSAALASVSNDMRKDLARMAR